MGNEGAVTLENSQVRTANAAARRVQAAAEDKTCVPAFRPVAALRLRIGLFTVVS